MKSPIKLLYITFIDMDKPPKSGSGVRPQRMYEAFKSLGYDIKLLSGIGNNHSVRKKGTKEISSWLESNKPDICYIEPPSGPFFYLCDRNLIRKIHRMGIPVGIFYRDAYWKFPEFEGTELKLSFVARCKRMLIRIMQKRDLRLIKKCCPVVYFPSKLMSSYFDFKDMQILPPGCFEIENDRINNQVCTAIYTGGASIRYGIKLLLDSAISINSEKTTLNLKLVCQEAGWRNFCSEYPQYAKYEGEWLEVYHLNAGEELEKLYTECDYAIVPILKNLYNDFAVPVKLFEYLSHQLPVVVTDCEETGAFVKKHNIGLVAKDNEKDFSSALIKMTENKSLRNEFINNCVSARNENLWAKRAEKVIDDLYSYLESDINNRE